MPPMRWQPRFVTFIARHFKPALQKLRRTGDPRCAGAGYPERFKRLAENPVLREIQDPL